MGMLGKLGKLDHTNHLQYPPYLCCPSSDRRLLDPKQPDRHVPPYAHGREAGDVDITPEEGGQPDSRLCGPLTDQSLLRPTEVCLRQRERCRDGGIGRGEEDVGVESRSEMTGGGHER